MTLYAGLPYKDRLGNDIYPDFRNMLRLEAVFHDAALSGHEKMLSALLLLYGKDNVPANTEAALGEFLWFYYRGKEPETPAGKVPVLFDFEEDADYIAGSFLSAYRLDLTDPRLHIHWWRFMSLFIALPGDTPMMQRMGDRNIDTSRMKGETRRYYEERKKAVALKSPKFRQGVTPEERRIAKQNRLDELYAEAERKLRERVEGGERE